MMIVGAAVISLWVSACIDGTLHGEPKTLCHDFQLPYRYPSVEACDKDRKHALEMWLKDLESFQLQLHLTASTCGPAQVGDDDI